MSDARKLVADLKKLRLYLEANTENEAVMLITRAIAALRPIALHPVASEAPPLEIVYKNWRGEICPRKIIPAPSGLRFGSNEWHKEPQWLLLAVDVEKRELREFALSGILHWGSIASEAQDKALNDALSFGMGVVRINADGTRERIAPEDVFVRPEPTAGEAQGECDPEPSEKAVEAAWGLGYVVNYNGVRARAFMDEGKHLSEALSAAYRIDLPRLLAAERRKAREEGIKAAVMWAAERAAHYDRQPHDQFQKGTFYADLARSILKLLEPEAQLAEVTAPDGLEGLRKDAARYQYLRSRDLETIKSGGIFAGRAPENVVVNLEDLDTSIDAALAEQK
jgi:hypothetical protein